MEWAVEDLGAADLELEDGELVAVTGRRVGGGQRAGQAGQPPPDEALDGCVAKVVAGLLEGPSIIDRGKAVVEGLVADVATLQVGASPSCGRYTIPGGSTAHTCRA